MSSLQAKSYVYHYYQHAGWKGTMRVAELTVRKVEPKVQVAELTKPTGKEVLIAEMAQVRAADMAVKGRAPAAVHGLVVAEAAGPSTSWGPAGAVAEPEAVVELEAATA